MKLEVRLQEGIGTVAGADRLGADGNVSPIPLPGEMQAAITGIGVFYPYGRRRDPAQQAERASRERARLDQLRRLRARDSRRFTTPLRSVCACRLAPAGHPTAPPQDRLAA
jgi:hypothetical protein